MPFEPASAPSGPRPTYPGHCEIVPVPGCPPFAFCSGQRASGPSTSAALDCPCSRALAVSRSRRECLPRPRYSIELEAALGPRGSPAGSLQRRDLRDSRRGALNVCVTGRSCRPPPRRCRSAASSASFSAARSRWWRRRLESSGALRVIARLSPVSRGLCGLRGVRLEPLTKRRGSPSACRPARSSHRVARCHTSEIPLDLRQTVGRRAGSGAVDIVARVARLLHSPVLTLLPSSALNAASCAAFSSPDATPRLLLFRARSRTSRRGCKRAETSRDVTVCSTTSSCGSSCGRLDARGAPSRLPSP